MYQQIKSFLAILIILVMPLAAQAEIYKWKDKNGVVRYSDTPPYTTQKFDTIGREKSKRLGSPANTSQPTTNPAESAAKSSKEALNKIKEVTKKDPAEEAARLKARNAENAKNEKMQKEKEAKLNRENCDAARANYQAYAQGGRVYKTLPNGERNYLGDAELEAGKVKAQAEINQYCQ